MYESCVYIGGGRIRFQKRQIMKKRAIKYHRILFMESGHGEFTVNKIPLSIIAGNVYLLAPGIREARYSGKTPVVYDYIEFDSPRKLIDEPFLICGIQEPFRDALIHLIRCTAQESGALRRQLLSAAIGLVLHDSAINTGSDLRLRRVINFIEKHPDQPVKIGTLVSLAGISEAQLRRIFHAELGVSPKQYLVRVRMEYACRLLSAEGLRVGEVADLLGFASPFQFSAQFRRFYGVPPSRYTAQISTHKKFGSF